MKTVRGSAGPIVVEDYGSGDLPLVLVHGMAGDAGFWRDAVEALGGRHRVIIPELRGHGRSGPATDGDYSITACAIDLLGVLDALELPRVVLVGHSFGGSVAMALASSAPERVAALVIVDGAGEFSLVPADAIAGFLAGLDSDDSYPDTVEGAFDVALEGARSDTEVRVRAAILAAPWPMVRSMYRSLFAYHPTEVIDSYSGPVLLVTAPVNAASFALHELRPKLPRERVEGVSHWIMMDEPVHFARLLEGFVSKVT
ncbi:MAG: alpha/beta fold hydrolase [Gemmatimonadota bacterium]